MFGSGLMSWLRPSEAVPESKWDPETLTMEQPASPSGPSLEHIVTEQPVGQGINKNSALESPCSCRSAVVLKEKSAVEFVLVSAALNAANAAAIVAATTGPMVLPLLPARPDLHE
ncbi:hypothetical protein RIB2604_03102810 [Aspergillus luchuensis]|uniref:Uncharacterized protein n=1 Tax=Aspergillus kawachii TaxID=1069201 RepID=A0A146FWU4_ASPKA|nr:hypothetical protein RIB2604_03102810 [Aspergillus luchuensis]